MIANYKQLENGLIKQTSFFNEKQTYNELYVNDRYNTYGEKGPQLSGIRLGHLITTIKEVPSSILDVGYGNGDFLKVCLSSIKNCYGNDISGYTVPNGVTFVDDISEKDYDVICFFDVLEHFEEINFVKNLKCKYFYISVPWCHYFSDEWFENWKHRRPDEHLWHFNPTSLQNFMKEMGFEVISTSNIEDLIRTTPFNYPNILTAIFKKL